MWSMIWPLLLIVLSNCFYNICTKSVPEGVNAFGTLTVTYHVGAVLNKREVMYLLMKNGLRMILKGRVVFPL